MLWSNILSFYLRLLSDRCLQISVRSSWNAKKDRGKRKIFKLRSCKEFNQQLPLDFLNKGWWFPSVWVKWWSDFFTASFRDSSRTPSSSFNSYLTWFCIQFRPLPQRWRLITCCYTRRLVKDVQYGAHARAVDWRWQLKWRQDQLSKGNQMSNHVLRNSWLTLYLASVPPNSIRTDEHLLVLWRIQTNMPNLI